MYTQSMRPLSVRAGLVLAASSIFFSDGASARADIASENPYVLETTTKSVAVFKNGFGFFMREGEVMLRDGWCTAGALPPAAFGTLAIYSHDEKQSVDVVGSGPGEIIAFDNIDAPDSLDVRHKRLHESLKLNVTLTYVEHGIERDATGRLDSVDTSFAIVMRDGMRYAVPIGEITRLQVLDMPLRIHVANDEDAAPSARSTLGIAYLRGGITWIPEYTIKIIDENTAKLTLRGTLVNEAEDIIHGNVSFVVGVPHFAHTDYLAPVAIGQMIRTIGTAIAPPELATQIMNRAGIVNNDFGANQFGLGSTLRAANAGNGRNALVSALGGLPIGDYAGGSDYTVYTKNDLTVRKGEKAIVTLFETTINYSHSYRWNVGGRVEHFLVLKNDTDTAWTTGPALAISGPQPLGEDLLLYTPRGGRCEYPVTAAVNIATNQTETEIDRQLKAHEPSRNVYLDLVMLEGRLTLKNFEPEPITIQVVAPVYGKPTHASEKGRLSVNTVQLQLTKRNGNVSWNVTLKPGETRTLKYEYERYVPSS